ncbi:MAG: DNA translocase FtsK [Lentisphaerae bacterium]|nr:DNA translocase FtsK [Lentisphaerota bacterium]
MAVRDNMESMSWRRVWGFLLMPLCLFIGLSVFSYDWKDISLLQAAPNSPPNNMIGPIGAWLSFAMFMLIGAGTYIVPVLVCAVGIILILDVETKTWPRIVAAIVLALTTSAMMELYDPWWVGICRRLNIVDAGGIFGHIFMQEFLVRWLSSVGAGIVVGSVLTASIVFLIGPSNIAKAYHAVVAGTMYTVLWLRDTIMGRLDEKRRILLEQRRLEKRRKRLERVVDKERRTTDIKPAMEQVEAGPVAEETLKIEEPRIEKTKPAKLRRDETKHKPESVAKESVSSVDADAGAWGNYQLPPLDLLSHVPSDTKGIETDTKTTSSILVETLAEFGVETEVANVQKGPVVTRYELLPAPGVRVEKISGLSNNLALALKATSVRVQAPVPGKGVVGIEVPNTTAKMVFLRTVLESEKWASTNLHVPLALGQDVGGNDLVADLADMPHLLIAGATGAGKTVCMNSILAGLLMSRRPDQLRLMLVDPKIVEFSAYQNLPHLVVPVITDAKKVALGLRWAINEMEKRYKLFAKVGVRNIEGYNNRETIKQADLFGNDLQEKPRTDEPVSLPYIVIIIDELADLMLVDQAEIENSVARLAQLSRAVGIHMILSTQRPSVNVITGTIKANFPARLAFQVAQKVDSRTILDASGAEKLLGRGDMLFLPPGASKLVRAQGAMASDKEIQDIVAFIKNQTGPCFELEIKEKLEKPASSIDNGEDDELLNQCIEIIRETRRASTSSLQRRLRIGYTRAARIMDILEERGIIGPPRGSDPREILIDLDGIIPENPVYEETMEEEPTDGSW